MTTLSALCQRIMFLWSSVQLQLFQNQIQFVKICRGNHPVPLNSMLSEKRTITKYFEEQRTSRAMLSQPCMQTKQRETRITKEFAETMRPVISVKFGKFCETLIEYSVVYCEETFTSPLAVRYSSIKTTASSSTRRVFIIFFTFDTSFLV